MTLSEKVLSCQQSPMRKFHPYAVAAEKAGKKVYHLNIGQPDIPTPPALFECVKNYASPVLSYAPSPGVPELLNAIQGYYRRLGVALDASDILVTTGGSEALSFACGCILDSGDALLIPEPYYPNYATFIKMAGGQVCPVPTKPSEGYFYADRERLEAALTPNTRGLLISNPGNPTGTCLTPEQMRMILEFCVEHELYLIADEVYREFTYDSTELLSFAQFDFGQENLILIDSVSKRFSACGARIGCLISRNRELMAQALKLCQARLSVATLDQLAAAALYDVEPDYFDAIRAEYKKRRDTVVQKLRQIPGVVCEMPKGAFYLMASLPVDDTQKFQKWLLEDFDDHGDTVMFAPGQSFYADGICGKNEVRIAYVLQQSDLERAMDLLALGIRAYQNAFLTSE